MERLPDLGALQTHQWNYLQEQMSRLVQAWQEGDPGELEQFLPAPDDVLRALTLQELIITDLEMRWRNRQHVSLDYYVGKYPELGRLDDLPTKLIYEEFRIRQRHGDLPHLLSYRRRFPRQFSELEVLLEQQPPPTPVKEPPLAPTNTFSGSGTMPNQNATVNGYKLLRRLASGAFADVYEAEAPGGIRVALKVIRQALTNEDAKREYEALEVFKVLSHSCLLQVHGIWIHQEQLYVAMDLADCTLRDRLQDFKDAGAREGGIPGIPPRELLGYFRDAAEALDYLHSENVLHRDVKPANILLFKAKRVRAAKPGAVEGFQARAKLADFGLAKLVESQRLDASGGGTLAYMAPEACRNRTNPQSDLYSLAASYAELRLGRPLFPYTNLYDLTRAHLEETPDLAPLPLGEQKVLLRALAKDPEDRFPTCQQFTSALEEVLPLPPRPSSATSHSVAGYRLARLIGGGVRGESWEAVAPDGTHVALTVIRNLPWAQAVEECRTLQFLRGIQHPNLTRLHDAFLLGEQNTVLTLDTPPPSGSATVSLGIVRELLPENLGQRLDRCEKGIPTRELIGYLWQAAEGLDALRGPYPVEPAAPAPTPAEPEQASRWSWVRKRQPSPVPEAAPETVTLVHAAVSPRTLFADGSTIKVGDFALVKLLHSTQGLLPGDETLLPGYVPPELYHKQAHANSDQYSLAITYVELRTGRPPFKSTAPASLMAEQKEGKLNLKRLPDAERDVLKRATALDPAERYPSCREMVAALEEACFTSGIRGPAHPPAAEEKHPATPPTFARPAAAAPAVTLSPEDSGEFVLRPAEPLPAALATAPHSLPLNLEETIGKADLVAGPAGDAIQETFASPNLPVPQPAAKTALKTERPKAGEKDGPRKDEPAPAKLATGQATRRAPKHGLAEKLGVTVAALGLVVVVGYLIHHAMTGDSSIPPPRSEARVRALIEKGEHVQAAAELKKPAASSELTTEKIEELAKENRAAWFARARAEFDARRYEDADKIAAELLADAPKHAEATALRVSVEQQRALARYRREADEALAAKDYPKARELADKSDAIPGGQAIATAIRARIPIPSVTISPADVAALATQLRKLPAGEKAQELAAKILAAQKDHKEAAAHERALRHLDELRAAQPPSGVTLAGSLRELAGFPESLPRIEEMCVAIADLADKNPAWVKEAGTALGGEVKLPPELLAYGHYVRALESSSLGEKAKAGDGVMEVIRREQGRPCVLGAEVRREKAAALLCDAADVLRVRNTLADPFQGGAEGATRASTWLRSAATLRGQAPEATAPALRLDLGLSALYRNTPDKAEALKLVNSFFLPNQSADVESLFKADGITLLLAHARCQDEASPAGRLAAIEDYARILERLAKDKGQGRPQDEVLYAAVVQPAARIVEQLPTPLADPRLKKPCAAVWTAKADLLAGNLDARWGGLTVEKARQEVVAARERAWQIDDKNPALLARKIEAHLAFVPNADRETLASDARRLIGLDSQSAVGHDLLVKALTREPGITGDVDKQKKEWLQVFRAAEAGLAALGHDAGSPVDKGSLEKWKDAAGQSLRDILQKHGYELLGKRQFPESRRLALELRDFDPIAAARIEGFVLHYDKKWPEAQRVFVAALGVAVEPANDWHIKLRQEYVNLLIAPGAKDRLLPKVKDGSEIVPCLAAGSLGVWQHFVLAHHADAVVALLNDTVDPLSLGPAYGAAGTAWAHAVDMLPATPRPERKRALLKATTYLDQALTQTPQHRLAPVWLESYADVVNDLRRSDPQDAEVLNHCRKAAGRLKAALAEGAMPRPPKDRLPRWNKLLTELSSAGKG